jgi:hypothetical protein
MGMGEALVAVDGGGRWLRLKGKVVGSSSVNGGGDVGRWFNVQQLWYI